MSQRSMTTAHQLHQSSGQRAVTTPDNYYSRGRFKPVVAANVATIGLGKSRLFSYAEGALMDPATPGETGTIATSADTNLVGAGGQTIGGHELEIFGLALQVVPKSRAGYLTAEIWSESCVSIIYNGKEIGLQVGPPYFVPGQSSLYGDGMDMGAEPPIGGGSGPVGTYSFCSNGLPGASNYMKIPEGLVWTSAGRADSNMTIVIELTRAVTQALNVTEAAATGIRGWTQPTAAQLVVDFMIKLHAKVTRARSRNI